MPRASFRIGVVGFSKPDFDHEQAATLLASGISAFIDRFSLNVGETEIVSGLTNAGVPRIAYQYAVAHGFRTVGISAGRALSVASGVFPVDCQILAGSEFGDESERFISHIDGLLRIGGGPQSRREVAMFSNKCLQEGWALDTRLVEHELAFHGSFDNSRAFAGAGRD